MLTFKPSILYPHDNTVIKVIKAALFLSALALLPFAALSAEPTSAELSKTSTPESASILSEQDEVESSEPEPISLSPEEQRALQEALSNRERYKNIIDQLELESEADVYSIALSEAYLNLAYTLRTLEQHQEAFAAFDKALQLTRISNGLNSPLQLPILQEILISNEMLEDWDAVDANSYLNIHITRKSFPVGDERRLHALDQHNRWKALAISENLLNRAGTQAFEIVDLYKNERRLFEKSINNESDNFYLASLYFGEAKAKLSLAKEILERPLSAYRTGEQQTIRTQRCYFITLPNGQRRQVCETVEVPNMNYYTDPSNSKSIELNRSLTGIRNGITDAQNALQSAPVDAEKSQRLINDLQELTKAYNEFVTKNLR